MRYDWYQATIPDHPIAIVDVLRSALDKDCEVIEGRGRHNYHQSFTLKAADGDRLATVLCGGPNGDPNVTTSGERTPEAVGVIRECWPQHRVTRFDAAEDFAEAGAFDRLEAVCREVAKQQKVKGRSIVPDDRADGRTYYLGAPSSDTRVRLYDKTAETRRRLPPERHEEIPDDWARLEVQVRPRKEWKLFAAQATPDQAWGFSGWTHELARRAFALDMERITMQAGRESDDARAFRFLVRQYGPMLARLMRDLGSWECLGLTIGEAVKAQEEARRRQG
jgi:DNA relaxase NicK